MWGKVFWERALSFEQLPKAIHYPPNINHLPNTPTKSSFVISWMVMQLVLAADAIPWDEVDTSRRSYMVNNQYRYNNGKTVIAVH